MSNEEETDLLEDMVDQLPPVPDTPNSGSQRVWVKEQVRKASTPMEGDDAPPEIGMYMKGEPEQVKSADAPVYHQGPGLVPRTRKSQSTI